MNRLILPFILLAAAPRASAQSFNVDIGANSNYPVPPTSYGGAANRVGVWNAVPATAATTGLVNLDGAPTSVTITTNGGADFEYDHTQTTAANEQLLDDLQDILTGTTWTISGLAAGQYDVYTYAWAPDSNVYFTNVSVQGSPNGTQVVGGDWTGNHVQGGTYARHSLTVNAGGSIVVQLSISIAYGSCNGFQIVTGDQGFVPFCFGTGQAAPCPCFNSGAAGRGCANSAVGIGGMLASAGGVSPDTLVLSASGAPPTVTAVFLQGDASAAPGVNFGDGLRCAAGNLKRLVTKICVNGATQFPEAGDPSVSAQSAALGDVLAPGATRYYQTYYRDPDPAFCPAPQGNTWNVTNGVIVVW